MIASDTLKHKKFSTNYANGMSSISDIPNYKLYHLYEYTDDICVLEDTPLYPGLLNYVKTGLLTDEELIEALQYGKGLGE